TLLANDPQNAEALYNLGAIYANQKDAARARQYWSRAIASDPQSESGQKARQGLETLRMIPVSSSAGADLSATRGRRAGVAK
ncbi:MAG TPA: tetratricopeptide repeat protein, partial [Terriglobia bacterium]|nr:tetratricopeptide repeat protein [Terriglobia bacterium]